MALCVFLFFASKEKGEAEERGTKLGHVETIVLRALVLSFQPVCFLFTANTDELRVN
jgi:hypothetical protein